jgi:predicted MFS family arabinose efflux permease
MVAHNSEDLRRRRWNVLAAIYLSVISFAVVLQMIAPNLRLMMADLHLSHTQGGLLLTFFALPGIIVSIPAGMLADRYSQKMIGVISLILMIVGTLVLSTGSSMAILATGRVIAGIGGVTIFVISPQLVAQWFAGRQLGIAMGLFSTAIPLGTILSLNVLSNLSDNLGWRTSVGLAAIPSALALLAFILLVKPAPHLNVKISPSVGVFKDLKQIGMSIWLVGAIWMMFNAAMVSLITFTPDLLQSGGFNISSAGLLTSLVMCPTLLLSPLVGLTIDKTDRRLLVMGTGGIVLAVLIMWVPLATAWYIMILLLVGMGMALVPTPMWASASRVSGYQRLGLGYGIVITFMNIGILFGPASAGLIRDSTGSYKFSYALLSGFSILITLIALILSRRRKTPV